MATREELARAKLQKYLEIAKRYLENDDLYDICKFAKRNDAIDSLDKWLVFAKEHLTKEEYELFVKKALPFEPEEEKEELKQKTIDLANRVFQKKAGLIEIIDELTPFASQYIYMVKLLRFTYKEVPPYVFNKNLEFYESVQSYNSKHLGFSTRFPNLTPEEDTMLKEIVEQRGLKLNDTTYCEAYKYAKRRGLIKIRTQGSR